VVRPTLGRTALDISAIGLKGLSVLDPGYADTAAYQSAITFVDGEEGRLYYRGYPVEQLATSTSFLDVAYLLINGELPTAQAADEFTGRVRDPKMVLHVGIERLFDAFPSPCTHGHAGHRHRGLERLRRRWRQAGQPAGVQQAGVRLLSAMPIFTGYALSTVRGLPRGKSNRSLDYAEDLLQLCFAIPGSDHLPDNVTARALNTLLVLHATTSSTAPPPPCAWWRLREPVFTPGLCGHQRPVGAAARWRQPGSDQDAPGDQGVGPPAQLLHRQGKDKNDPFRLMGFGHRVYKTTDARAKVIRNIALDLVEKLAPQDPLLDIALDLEEVALADEYFISRRLYPNVDFYSGVIYRLSGSRRDVHPPLRRRAHGRLGGTLVGDD